MGLLMFYGIKHNFYKWISISRNVVPLNLLSGYQLRLNINGRYIIIIKDGGIS